MSPQSAEGGVCPSHSTYLRRLVTVNSFSPHSGCEPSRKPVAMLRPGTVFLRDVVAGPRNAMVPGTVPSPGGGACLGRGPGPQLS